MKYLLGIILFFQFSCVNNEKAKKEIESKGKVSQSNKRIGEWEYSYDNKVIAKGSYQEGLKEGEWKYTDKLYNQTHEIDWQIFSNDLFKINIPRDWSIDESLGGYIPITFSYRSKFSSNGNIVIANDDVIDLEQSKKELIEKNSNNSVDYKLINTRKVHINNLEAIVVQQNINIENRLLYVEQYLIKDSDIIYIVSFFTKESFKRSFQQLFKEIAYSFTTN